MLTSGTLTGYRPAEAIPLVPMSEEYQSPHEPYLSEIEVNRTLTEVDHLNRLRRPDGSHDPFVEQELLKNLKPAVKEAAIPHAVSDIYQVKRGADFWWLDQTSAEVAASGYKFHEHAAALGRVAIEVEEDADVRERLRPGQVKILISPRMTIKDAPVQVAKQEHLADDDMVRIHWLDEQDGQIRGKYMQSALVRDIPIEAWTAMLADPASIFGRKIADGLESAYDVMRQHTQLYLPAEALPEGVISVIGAALPYVQKIDEPAAVSLESQLALLRGDQATIDQRAEAIARRWLEFEKQLADSLKTGLLAADIREFIESVWSQTTDEFQALIRKHYVAEGVLATRELAAAIERLKQNTLWTSAGVVSGNAMIIRQLSPESYQRIYTNEMFLQQIFYEGLAPQAAKQLEAENQKLIAEANVKTGGGCPGILENLFRGSGQKNDEAESQEKTEVMKCVTCPLCGSEGVDAKIKHDKKAHKKTITCSKCKQSKVYSE